MRMLGLFICATTLIGFFGTARILHASEDNLWAGFYRLANPAVQATGTIAYPTSFCLTAILDAQQRYDIPDNLLLAIGLQEAGRKVNGALTIWPWTANYDGKGVFFGSKEAMQAWVQQKQDEGAESIDVGCMQINQKWHGHHFDTLDEASDPAANVDYAARFLSDLYAQTGDWWQAAGRYHSSTDSYKDIYLKKLAHNQQLANMNLDRFTLEARTEVAISAPVRPAPTISWSADITGTGAAGLHNSFSIYSAAPLQPILPAYAEVN
jgi:Transglycosylase SLT domain